MKWINGKPPNFDEKRIWIVMEIPSLFSEKAFSYKTAVWNRTNWSTKEVERATKWALLPLPKKEEQI